MNSIATVYGPLDGETHSPSALSDASALAAAIGAETRNIGLLGRLLWLDAATAQVDPFDPHVD
jgi:hypothetical protein